ncbi:MAG: hypothetical protein A3D52_00190 [Candidatus Taylorbacteria bacterium RIFCSPHIGHO2_02_FULL_44_36]|uniref:Alpha-D-phosphohexomutase alpha/beta/alpha domain-containing protein n=1 Tax=Candidatus Taylorbacteria bacterium RIFCSPLOWO2_12_FULL_44_15c TaxID=1802333 RepID=A0A1G2P489_9BACT|nr:MAG: hypothetical protein A3D52_00190 [Candidatus Taylorbacteria bacterium RIFCSPHIGHO2_02_FULL_44_36]OHA38159.1 MAG: hypothetical protein A3I97_01975 [Candidatus Taylorbacteria bacterium RIFCSPLOWO2_02_FULL_44_35]OHA43154.1 MAG: hypothetical protein A3G03_00325 [Candidatus Taylorbacteria bacterium RIFCSPLOWO2_12_FULL_44_15c]
MDYFKIYADFLKKFLKVQRPLFAVLDAFNGVAGVVAKGVFADYPLVQLTYLNDLPDGNFPAHGPNPLLAGALKELCQKVVKQKADLGVAFDADGDRALFVDNLGRLVPAYGSAYLIFRNRRLPFVVDELLFKVFQHLGLIDLKNIIPSRVGYAFIRTAMRQSNASSTAEYSGHYCFEETFQADSALFTFIQVLNNLSAQRQTLAEFYDSLPAFAVDMENFKFKAATDWLAIRKKFVGHFRGKAKEVAERDGLTFDFGDSWLNIRLSNNEPLLRFTAGAKTFSVVAELLKESRGFPQWI